MTVGQSADAVKRYIYDAPKIRTAHTCVYMVQTPLCHQKWRSPWALMPRCHQKWQTPRPRTPRRHRKWRPSSSALPPGRHVTATGSDVTATVSDSRWRRRHCPAAGDDCRWPPFRHKHGASPQQEEILNTGHPWTVGPLLFIVPITSPIHSHDDHVGLPLKLVNA